MLSSEIRARLTRLYAPQPSADSQRPSTHIGISAGPVGVTRPAPSIETLLALGEECENASGRHLRFRRAITDCWPGALRAMASLPAGGRAAENLLHAELTAVARWLPHGTLFLDLETCGFAGSMVFLAGLVWQRDGVLVIDQLLARNYAEERALLESLWQVAAGNRVLVTFNGKSFDWPMVHDRSTRHHLGRDLRGSHAAAEPAAAPLDCLGRRDARPELVHCDLLHHARRRWKRRLPNCKLQTLERYLCNRVRHGDLAGALVPAAYHDFVRSGDLGGLGDILHHNALDLVTLGELTCRLLLTSEPVAARPAARSA